MIPARRSPAMLAFFDRYVERYVRGRFHRLLLWPAGGARAIPDGRSLIFAMSHASWWDVLVGYVLARRVVRVESYAPMDEAQLARYRILSRLGVYSVDRGSMAGIREFLRYSTERLRAGGALWITPQGEIAPHWRRPVRFQPGLGHLVRRVTGVAVVPVAVAYEFLEEPRPEILVKMGAARVFEHGDQPARITRVLEQALEAELDALRDAILARDFGPFVTLIAGKTSTSAVYDRVRAARAWVTGRPDPQRHGDVVSDPRRLAS
jgi:1-acyl-sn-glycerol-3-phosphate acyltransferase